MLYFHDLFRINRDRFIFLPIDYIDFRCNLVNISHQFCNYSCFLLGLDFMLICFEILHLNFNTTVHYICIEFSNHLLLLFAFCGFDGTISFQVMISWDDVFGTRQIFNKHVCSIVIACIYKALLGLVGTTCQNSQGVFQV